MFLSEHTYVSKELHSERAYHFDDVYCNEKIKKIKNTIVIVVLVVVVLLYGVFRSVVYVKSYRLYSVC